MGRQAGHGPADIKHRPPLHPDVAAAALTSGYLHRRCISGALPGERSCTWVFSALGGQRAALSTLIKPKKGKQYLESAGTLLENEEAVVSARDVKQGPALLD